MPGIVAVYTPSLHDVMVAIFSFIYLSALKFLGSAFQEMFILEILHLSLHPWHCIVPQASLGVPLEAPEHFGLAPVTTGSAGPKKHCFLESHIELLSWLAKGH